MLDKIGTLTSKSKITGFFGRCSASHHVDDVVDLEDTSDRLCSQVDGGRGDEERLDDILLQDVRDGSFPHVYTGRLLSLSVPEGGRYRRQFQDSFMRRKPYMRDGRVGVRVHRVGPGCRHR